MNLTVVLTISLSPLSTNMRLPTTEFFSFFVATGQFSSPPLRKILIILFMTCMQLIHVGCRFHIAGAKFSLLDQPPCNRWYTIQPDDTCNFIAKYHHVPTFVSPYITFSHFTYALKYSYQIMCQNDSINGKCTNLRVDEVKMVFRLFLGTF